MEVSGREVRRRGSSGALWVWWQMGIHTGCIT